MMDGLFPKTLLLLEKVLDLRGIRHEVLVSNITNQDTPGYRSRDLDFQKALVQALERPQGASLRRTHPDHFPGLRNGDSPLPLQVRPDPPGLDGNNVRPDREMASLAENSILYNAAAQILRKEFEGLLNSIREGR